MKNVPPSETSRNTNSSSSEPAANVSCAATSFSNASSRAAMACRTKINGELVKRTKVPLRKNVSGEMKVEMYLFALRFVNHSHPLGHFPCTQRSPVHYVCFFRKLKKTLEINLEKRSARQRSYYSTMYVTVYTINANANKSRRYATKK